MNKLRTALATAAAAALGLAALATAPAQAAAQPAFLAASALGALLWNSILIGAGYLLAAHYHLVERVLDPATMIVLVACVAIYLYRVVTWRPGLPP